MPNSALLPIIGQSSYARDMDRVTITAARDRLSALVDEARTAPVYLTRRDRDVAAIVDADVLRRLLDDAEELADIKAATAAEAEAERLDEVPVPWDEVKRDLGLS